jgi:hypothetical protein
MEGNCYVEFERDFRSLLTPWTESEVRLECADCGIECKDACDHYVEKEDRYLDLCEKCYVKCVDDPSGDQMKEVAEPASKRDIDALAESARLLIKTPRCSGQSLSNQCCPEHLVPSD